MTNSFQPIAGRFKRMKHNLAKVNLLLTSLPPLLNDDSGWEYASKNAENYARILRESGIWGAMLDNESYFRPKQLVGKPLDYWVIKDQLTLSKLDQTVEHEELMHALARKRGRQLAAAMFAGFERMTIVVAHGPYVGCTSAAKANGTWGSDSYLMGSFFAGMVEGTPKGQKIVDGGELYSLRSEDEFRRSRHIRKFLEAPPSPTSTFAATLDCPFGGIEMTRIWKERVGVAFGTFDRKPGRRPEAPLENDLDANQFENTIRFASKYTDRIVWHYTQWQDWLGDKGARQVGNGA